LGHEHAEEAELPHLREDRLGDPALPIPAGGMRSELGARELARGFADHALLVGEKVRVGACQHGRYFDMLSTLSRFSCAFLLRSSCIPLASSSAFTCAPKASLRARSWASACSFAASTLGASL